MRRMRMINSKRKAFRLFFSKRNDFITNKRHICEHRSRICRKSNERGKKINSEMIHFEREKLMLQNCYFRIFHSRKENFFFCNKFSFHQHRLQSLFIAIEGKKKKSKLEKPWSMWVFESVQVIFRSVEVRLRRVEPVQMYLDVESNNNKWLYFSYTFFSY